MEATRQEKKDSWLEIHDRVDALRTDYLRELTGLAKIFITISSAMLGLTLVPFSPPDLLIKTALSWLIFTWITLIATSVLGFMQIFFFSGRFKVKADYLWKSHLTDVVLHFGGSDEKVEEFSDKADGYKRCYDRQYWLCIVLLLVQFFLLLISFGCLAIFIWLNYKAKGLL